jgi:hypothetical protein
MSVGINIYIGSTVTLQACDVVSNTVAGVDVSGGRVLVVDSRFDGNAYDAGVQRSGVSAGKVFVYSDGIGLSLTPDSEGIVRDADNTSTALGFLSSDDPGFLNLERVRRRLVACTASINRMSRGSC